MQKYKTVDEFLDDLDAGKRAQVEAIRQIILDSNPDLNEHIKWNAPSYVYNGDDRITFNVMNKEGVVKLVIHMGATRKENKKAVPILKDTTGLVAWASDIRGMITFEGAEDVRAKSQELTQLFTRWFEIK